MNQSEILLLFKTAVREQQVKISLHATEEAFAEGITRTEIEMVLADGRILEDYPDWWLGPSCLLHGQTKAGRHLHIVASYSGLPVTVITVYEPSPPRWVTPSERGGRER